MRLDINFIVNEFNGSVSLEFDIMNKPRDFGESTKDKPEGYEFCFNYNWGGREPGLVRGKSIDDLYEPAAKKLAGFIKSKCEETPIVHFQLTSFTKPAYVGTYVKENAFKKRFSRAMEMDELRKIGDELKKALKGE